MKHPTCRVARPAAALLAALAALAHLPGPAAAPTAARPAPVTAPTAAPATPPPTARPAPVTAPTAAPAPTAGHEGHVLPLSPEQEAAMGIRLGDPRQIGDTEGSRFPAEVVVPNAQLQVVSSVLPGVIERLLVGEGEEVQAGQVLLQLKSPTLLEREGNYLQLLTKRDLAVRTMARDSKLAEEGIIARRRQQESEAAHQELATLAEAERQSLALAGLPEARIAELTDKRLLHSGLDIVSPLDGVVLEQMVIAGQRVEAATPLYRIGKLRPLWLEIHVPLARAATARIGGRVRLPDQAAEGRIIAVGREVHREDQGVLIRAVVEDGAERLRPRQFVQVQVVEVGREPAFRVPRTAVVRDGAEAFLFLQIQGGFVARVVRILDEQGEEFLVAGNIPVGARMVVAGTVALKAALLGGPEGYHPP